jgi:hypothetical protein
MNQFVQIEQRERQRRLIARLQERNQKLQEEIAWNEQIIKELAENPEQQEEDEYYKDSVEDSESFDNIASLEIIDPPPQRIFYTHPKAYIPRAGTDGPSLAVQEAQRITRAATAAAVSKEERTKATRAKQASPDVKPTAKKKGDTPTPKKRTKKDEMKESFEKARAQALHRKDAREVKEEE